MTEVTTSCMVLTGKAFYRIDLGTFGTRTQIGTTDDFGLGQDSAELVSVWPICRWAAY